MTDPDIAAGDVVRLKSDTADGTRMVVDAIDADKGTARVFWMHDGAVTAYHIPLHCLEKV